MEKAINIDNRIDKNTVDVIEKLIKTVFEEGFKNHMEQETIRAALRMIENSVALRNLTITNCTFEGDSTIPHIERK